MDNYEFINTAYKIATDIPTKYMLGGWGNQEDGYYLFDCVCLIKSILWGFNFSTGAHGGAIYESNGVPDVGANKMIELCDNISYDFKEISIGEILWLDGHVGIYIGDRCVVEATTAWEDKVLISEVLENGIRIKNNHQVYRWIKHGYLPYIKYNPAYAKIISFKLSDITSKSVKISYDVDLPIDEALYSLDNKNYLPIPENYIIDNLVPNMDYEITIKVKRKYTNNYTESSSIKFKTLDEPITLKYKVNDMVLVNGKIYTSPFSMDVIIKVKKYIAKITSTNNSYNVLNPYEINKIGWVKEENIRLYKKPNILKIIKYIFKGILIYLLLPFGIIFLIFLFLSFFMV